MAKLRGYLVGGRIMGNGVFHVVQERFLKLLNKELKKSDVTGNLVFESFDDFSDYCFRKGLPVYKFTAIKLSNPHEAFLDLLSGRHDFTEIYRAIVQARSKESDYPVGVVFAGIRNELFIGIDYDSRVANWKGIVYVNIAGECLVMRVRDFLKYLFNHQV